MIINQPTLLCDITDPVEILSTDLDNAKEALMGNQNVLYEVK